MDRIVSRSKDGLDDLVELYRRGSEKSLGERLAEPTSSATLTSFCFGGNADAAQNDADSQSEDDEVDIGGDSDYGEDSDPDEEGESRSHGAARKLTSVGGTAAQLWSSMGKKVSPAWVARVAAGSTSLTCIHELIKSLPADLSDRLKDVGTMPNGLPTLGIFPQDTSETALRERLVSGIAFMEEKCEQLWPWVVPPAGPLGDDKWSASAESENARRSWHVGLTPANLFGALLMMFVQGQLEPCHLFGISLREADIPVTTLAHRIHGLPGGASEIDCAEPTSIAQYRDSSHMSVMQTFAEWAQKSWKGSIFHLHKASRHLKRPH